MWWLLWKFHRKHSVGYSLKLLNLDLNQLIKISRLKMCLAYIVFYDGLLNNVSNCWCLVTRFIANNSDVSC